MVKRAKTSDKDEDIDEAAADEYYGKEELDKLQAGLKVDKHSLDDELIKQPGLIFEIASEAALWASRRDAAKQRSQSVEAEADARIRHDIEVAGDKVTEKLVESCKRVDPKVKASQADLLRFNLTVAKFSGMQEAYRSRGYVLKDLCALHADAYWASNSERSGDVRAAKARKGEEGRKVLQKERLRRAREEE